LAAVYPREVFLYNIAALHNGLETARDDIELNLNVLVLVFDLSANIFEKLGQSKVKARVQCRAELHEFLIGQVTERLTFANIVKHQLEISEGLIIALFD
jgi:hypothetical protein